MNALKTAQRLGYEFPTIKKAIELREENDDDDDDDEEEKWNILDTLGDIFDDQENMDDDDSY